MTEDTLKRTSIACFWLIGVLFLYKLVVSVILPITPDEAYYVSWGRELAFGYFDHPPGVAFLTLFSRLFDSSQLAARFLNIAVSVLGNYLFYRLLIALKFKSLEAVFASLLMTATSFVGVVSGVLTTPDSILALAWVWALKESYQALCGEHRRWLWAGCATGIGLLSKYTMVVIGPVFLLGLILINSRQLRTPWPYLGGLLALFIFSPNLLWNSTNGWATWQFQLKHGFSMERGLTRVDELPKPLPKIEKSTENQLSLPFKQAEKKVEPLPKPKKDPIQKLFIRLGDFLGSQLGLWGASVPLVFIFLFQLLRRSRQTLFEEMERSGVRYMVIACLIPLAIFFPISFFSKIEGNWPAMYLFGLAPLVGALVSRHKKWLIGGAGANLLLFLILSLHSHFEFGPPKGQGDRILKETHGFKMLAKQFNGQDELVFADKYQVVSMLRFYSPELDVYQWPGITRTSHFLFNGDNVSRSVDTLNARGSFSLVTTDKTPPRLMGYRPVLVRIVRDCPGDQLQILRAEELEANPLCRHAYHTWYIINYKKV